MKQDKKEKQNNILYSVLRFSPGHCHVWYRNIWYDFKQN